MQTLQTEIENQTQAHAFARTREDKQLPSVVRQRVNRLSHLLGQRAAEQQHQRLTALAQVQQQQGSTAEQLLNLITSVAGIRH